MLKFSTHSGFHDLYLKDINNLTPVRGQDGKISDTHRKDFWSQTMLESFPWVSEIFPSCPLTGV
jgi:hypothetical protein